MSDDNDKNVREKSGTPAGEVAIIAEDVETLHSLGYAQELLRRMSGFSNFAISFSIICILAGGLTSFQLGISSVGGASVGIGWPLCCLISLSLALTMGQVSSAFPTAGGLYHWSSILGGRGWGWATAWFNLMGLITVLAAINVGAYLFTTSSLGPLVGFSIAELTPTQALVAQVIGVGVITFSQALFNHLGIRLTTRLTDFSGYLILLVTIVLTLAMLFCAPHLDFSRLFTFTNYSGPKGGDVWPENSSMGMLFLLGFLLPAYTVTGFDASAHTSEETVGAAINVPRGIIRAVVVSGVFGWIMLAAIVLAIPDMDTAASKGAEVFFWTMASVIPKPLAVALYVGIVITQYLCGLATVTSASRMMYAFARDGGLPLSQRLRKVSPKYRTPAIAIWTACTLTLLFTVYTPVYTTITAVCVIFLYLSYVMPTLVGIFAYGKTWVKMGPWDIGAFYRPIAIASLLGCALVMFVSFQPPNDKALIITLGAAALTAVVWFGLERRRFQGPPQGVMLQNRQAAIEAAERAVGQSAASSVSDPTLAHNPND
jgi:amino acid transporter